jgi:RHH-type proline utilization regulon transcriptional repressor/proline dehydrogenase/delta 1-pyrroline-5-carboxylate dehydrogenase
MPSETVTPPPFAVFARPISDPTNLRKRIAEAYRLPEPKAVGALLPMAEVDAALRPTIAKTASALVEALRTKGQRGGVEGLVKEYSLSSQEGVALMCLAEALLRIPDNEHPRRVDPRQDCRRGLAAHLGGGRSLFVNAATWGLVVTGKLTASVDEAGLGSALTRLIARAGRTRDPARGRYGDAADGRTVRHRRDHCRSAQTMPAREARGFSYSYDMLGEAATTAAMTPQRYYADYETAIHAIGEAAAGRGHSMPGPASRSSCRRCTRAMPAPRRPGSWQELLPRVKALALLAMPL